LGAAGSGLSGFGEMAKTNPFEFIQQVRDEGAKVTWPTRRETLITSGLVIALSVVAAIFFLIVDLIIRNGLQFLLGIFR
jgi:preprotein translocase subunit SecE